MSKKDFKQFENGVCTFKHCGRPMDEHERDVGMGVWDCPKPQVTPPERPRGKKRNTMLRDVTEAVEGIVKRNKELRDDPKVKEMTTLLMTGRAAERQDLVEEVERMMRANYGNAPVHNALRAVRNWALERDARAKERE